MMMNHDENIETIHSSIMNMKMTMIQDGSTDNVVQNVVVEDKEDGRHDCSTTTPSSTVFNGGKMEHIFQFEKDPTTKQNLYSADQFSSPQALEALQHSHNMYWKMQSERKNDWVFYNSGT